MKDHQFILRNTRSDLETTVLKGMRVATPGVIEISTTILCQKNASFGNLDVRMVHQFTRMQEAMSEQQVSQTHQLLTMKFIDS